MIASLLVACMLSGTPTVQATDSKPTQEQKDTTTTKKPAKLVVIIGGKKIVK